MNIPRFLFLLCAVAAPLLAQDPDWVRDWESAQPARPQSISSHSRIAPNGEPGEPLIVHGRVLKADGVTSAAGVIVFAYHTDAKGLYNKPGLSGWRLKGWAKTNQAGEFEFATIRPAPYPSRQVPAHIHFTIESGGIPRQWVEEVCFADDPLVRKTQLERSTAAGIFGEVRPVRREAKAQHINLAIRAKPKKDF